MLLIAIFSYFTNCPWSKHEEECPYYVFMLMGVWIFIEISFLYIIYKIYKKAKDEEYKILNIIPVMGIVSDLSSFKPIRRAINIEFQGIEIKHIEKNYIKETITDRLPRLNTWVTINEEEQLNKIEDRTIITSKPIPEKWRKPLKNKKNFVSFIFSLL